MSRPLLLVFLLVVLVITSQFEWRQQLDMDTNPGESQKQQQIPRREEVVKEKIILSQEKKIQSLNEVVKSLKEQLQQCQISNETSLTENAMELEQHIPEV